MPDGTDRTPDPSPAAPGGSDIASATRAADGGGRRSVGTIARLVLPIVVVLVVCFAAVGLHVSKDRHLGPLDEQAHLDYINRLQHGHLPELGQKLSRETRHQVACRGLETPVGFGDHPNCHVYRTDAVLPEDGNAYEAGQPPIYYGVTAAIAKVMPGDDIDSIKRVGGLWLGVGAIFLYLALRKLGRGQAFSVLLTLALALSPPLVMGASSVGNDVAVWTFGAVGLWAVIGLMRVPALRWPHLLIGAAIGVAGGLTKPSALLITGAFAIAVVLQQWWVGRPRWGLMLAGALVAGAIAATGAWGLVVTSLQQRPIDHVAPWGRYRVSSLALGQLLKQPLFNLVTTLKAFIPVPWRYDWILEVVIQVAVYVQIGLLILPLLGRWPDDDRKIGRSVGLTYLAVIAVSGPYYVILYYVATHILYGADTRFAFGFIPMMAVVLATWVPHAWQRWVLAAVLALPAVWYMVLVSGAVTTTTR
jgi:hypothetical protein